MKKILVLTGSVRPNSNSGMMADAFIRGAQEAGHEVIKYEAGKKNFRGCVGCETCFSLGEDHACTRDEVFSKELAPLYQSVDMVVFATPSYWYTFPSQIKAAFDMYYSLMVGKRPQPIKEAALLVSGAGKDDYKYEAIIRTFELICADRKWECRGSVVASGIHKTGAVADGDALARAEAFGKTM